MREYYVKKAKTEPKIKVFCHTRETKMSLAPHRWLDILENVIRYPEKTINQNSLKHTVKVGLSPWGDVCIQRTEWTMRKKLFSSVQPFRRKVFWNNLLELIECEIPITPPVLYIEIREGKFIARSYLATKWIEGPSLAQLAGERDTSSENALLDLLKRSTQIIAYMHIMGFLHGNLKWSSILCDPLASGQVILSDLENIQSTTSFSDQGKDLGRFVISVYKYAMEEEVLNWLIECYFFAAGYRPEEFERSLIRYIKKNKHGYENP